MTLFYLAAIAALVLVSSVATVDQGTTPLGRADRDPAAAVALD
ncbi:MAG: hypothetical protein ACK5PP_18620 [Acidimicrobiales bacterium]